MYPTPDSSPRPWIEIPADSDFTLQNFPFGIFETGTLGARAATAIGDFVVDLAAMQELRYFDDLHLPRGIFEQPYLNDFIALGPATWRAVRKRLIALFSTDGPGALRNYPDSQDEVLHPHSEVRMRMPVYVRDYTDFYSSEEHATNVGTMFRGKENALMPNWKHLPVAYHGRASSIVVSGTPVRRPWGQLKPGDGDPVHAPSRLLDFELEMGAIIGQGNALGEPIPTAQAEDHIFGLLLFNDWSARDIQKWEYVPLGPFLGKNFASSVSPWIVTLDALAPFRVPGPKQDPPVLPYLRAEGDRNFDIQLEVAIEVPGYPEQVVCRSNHRYLYWSLAQQIAHHASGGCNLQVGDLLASGTISGPTPDSYGSMLELSWRGSKPLSMPDGSERRFLQDGDVVIMRAFAAKEGLRVGFGEVRTEILPALEG
ncbi:MAG: fumarylacetoacetase [Bacteroidetes bacterium]|nr:MAG: fumarylacetoacetase [Bacteroidota bacterium]